MTRDEAVTVIQNQLGFRTDLAANMVTALKQSQVTLEKGAVKPWFLLSERTYITTTATESRIPLPSDFIMESDDDGLTYLPAGQKPIKLNKDIFTQLREYYGNATGAPESFALDGEYFRIFPIPDAAYTIEMYYYKHDTVLDTNIENKWLKHIPFYLIGEAGMLLAGGLRDEKAAQTFDRMRKEAQQQLYRENEARKYANMPMQIGGAH